MNISFFFSILLLLHLGDVHKTLVCEVLGAAVKSGAPIYAQTKAIHQAQCILTGHASMITEIPPEKFNMGKSFN